MKPTIPAQIAATPIPARTVGQCDLVPGSVKKQCRRRNKDKRNDVGPPIRSAWRPNPVISGPSLVIVAAAKAASATGGVIMDIMPK